MKYQEVEYGYAESRSYDFKSINVSIKVKVELEEGEKASDAVNALRDNVQQRVIADADEALANLITRTDDAKADK